MALEPLSQRGGVQGVPGYRLILQRTSGLSCHTGDDTTSASLVPAVDLQCCKGAYQKHLQMFNVSQLVTRLITEAKYPGFQVTVLQCACAPLSTAPCRTSEEGQMCVLGTAEGDGGQGPAHIPVLDLVCPEGWDRDHPVSLAAWHRTDTLLDSPSVALPGRS